MEELAPDEIEPRRKGWLVRPDAELEEVLFSIKRRLGASKDGTLAHLVRLGSAEYFLREKENAHLEELRAQGLTLQSILPYIGGGPKRDSGKDKK